MTTSSGFITPAAVSDSAIVNQTSLVPDRLDQLSLVSISVPASSAFSNAAVNNIFNGINVAFSVSSIPVTLILASVTCNANQTLPTATGLLQATVASMLLIKSVLPPSAATSVLSRVDHFVPASSIDVFDIASQASGARPTTLITLWPDCSPLRVSARNLQLSTGVATMLRQFSSGLPQSPISQFATFAYQAEMSESSFTLSLATSGALSLPCTNINPPSSPICSLVPVNVGNVVPRNGLLPCGSCPANGRTSERRPLPVAFFNLILWCCYLLLLSNRHHWADIS